MNRVGHQFTGLAMGLGLAGSYHANLHAYVWSVLPMAWIGGTAPDRLEYFGSHRWLVHRTLTHWWVFWVALLWYSVTYLQGTIQMMGLGFAAGCLTHIICDWPNPMGIPTWHPWVRGSLNWWRSGDQEWWLVPLAMLASIIPWLPFLYSLPVVANHPYLSRLLAPIVQYL